MKGFLKKISFFKRYFIFTAAFAAVFLTTCDLPMGLGDPVDTEAPLVSILSPQNNQVVKGIPQGKPFEMTGGWLDNMGVTALEFQITRKDTKESVEIVSVKYNIYEEEQKSDGRKWDAEIVIDADNVYEYNIKVFAYDRFRNKGADEIDVRLDIVPPWVDSAKIIRIPGVSAAVQDISDEIDRNFYTGLGVFNQADAYKNILSKDIEYFQNEEFTLQVNIKTNIDFDVGAARLYLLLDGIPDNYINTEQKPGDGNMPSEAFFVDGIVPTTSTNSNKVHEWKITHSQLETWRSQLASGPHYISFEVWAWNLTSWDGVNNHPDYADGVSRTQKINGTCWYPESDYPHIWFNREGISLGNIITLPASQVNALTNVEFFEDDYLEEAYLGLITKEELDNLKGAGVTDEAYFTLLESDPTRRAAVLAKLPVADRANRITGTDPRITYQSLTTGAEGEYRLIAFVKEKKTTDPKWTVYPPLRVQVQNPQAPIIMIEDPQRENIFPNISGGRYFSISGYVLHSGDLTGAGFGELKIAWIPISAVSTSTVPQIVYGDSVVTTQFAEQILLGNESNADVIVKTIEASGVGDPIVMGATTYKQTYFSVTYDIVDDFKYTVTGDGPNAVLQTQNNNKLFVIYADNGTPVFKTFRLLGWNEGPQINVERYTSHDYSLDLKLDMRVSPSSAGIAVDPITYSITDSTGDSISQSYNSSQPFATYDTSGNVQRTVSKEFIHGEAVPGVYIPEGTPRTYRFAAKDILGNEREVTRSIIMSNAPVLESIICTQGSGTYGIGTTLKFEASFSMSIRLQSASEELKPKIRFFTTLNAAQNDNGIGPADLTAEYVSYTGSTVVFQLVVTSDTLDVAKLYTPESEYSITNRGNLLSANNVAASTPPNYRKLQEDYDIALDRTRPYFERVSFAQLNGATSGTSYFNNGKVVTMKLWTSEQPRVSGVSPVVQIRRAGSNANINASYTKITQQTVGGKNYYIINFETAPLTLGNTVAESQLSWAGGFASNRDNITDMSGNTLSTDSNLIPQGVHSRGDASTPWVVENAYVKTTPPASPTVSLYRANNGTLAFPANPVNINFNAPVYLRVTGNEQNGTLFYSTEGGNNGQTYSNQVTLADTNSGNRFLTTYQPSSYAVTAWQEDRAGNASPQVASRQVTINSRAPELDSFDISVPDGIYPAGQQITFTFNFSRKVIVNNNAQVNLMIRGTEAEYQGQINIPGVPVPAGTSSVVRATWTIAGSGAPLKNIKLVRVSFLNINDEYGNNLVAYDGTAPESGQNNNRPIADNSSFQMSRSALGIRFVGPDLSSATPALPTTGNNLNGGTLAAGSKTIILNFNTEVEAIAGKTITVRPYGNWAIPPVLTAAEFGALYDYQFIDPSTGDPVSAATKTAYQRRLKDVDANGLPNPGAEPGNTNGYNSYVKNTHGLVAGSTGANGKARPDTTTKMVLDFSTDISGTGTKTNNLRQVFNAARWKWQTVYASSGSVEVSGKVVTITLDNALDDGRIWEVYVEAGAFQDAAGNPSTAITGTQCRFWSDGTAAPVIRAERVSYDGNRTWAIGNTASNQTRPQIDTRVRIDCETPGSEIRYNVVRTHIALAAGADTFANGAPNTQAGFFGTDLGIATGTNGYQRETIGNDVVADYKDSEGYFRRLLVPNAVQTGPTAIAGAIANTDTDASPNGTINYSVLTGLGTALQSWGGVTNPQATYQTIAANNGAVTYASMNASQFISIGDAYPNGNTTPVLTVTSDTDTRLFTGRRDYIVAVARKAPVTSGDAAGTQKAVSAMAMEGVYKTTLIYRNPRRSNNDVGRLLVQGFDSPVTPVVAGFPLKDADSNSTDTTSFTNRFSRAAYRIYSNNQNHFVWVTWEIVTDWYQKSKAFSANDAGNFMNNTNRNYNSVTAPYGGIIYRYQQAHY